MPAREQPDLPYRTAFTPEASDIPATQDEADYDTLKRVELILDNAVDGLYKEFNAFEVIHSGKTDQAAVESFMRVVAGKQAAYEILTPVLERVKSAIHSADANYRKRNS